ncbi:hypothetical protein QMW88_19460 [Cronobacter dublinensis]|uniref:hypothetical protein n=1 Tax=Cronobacter TaxID=413496 RepID=UPI0024AE871D|nr:MULTISPECIES: hypothetical protein [Cronobacter]MDI6440312.1 hypothetical protein [Cronobacter dublinensis]MDI7689209.1 hypothetical protein [Cronobacter malonaticus]MDK1194726.1 hypothetical protein [Cronobacter dublinensis]MDK1203410.1 hypothetical protein [Cronobacter dublinensis]MDK1300930.1 hypothetical protein [Cronobacter malonaticus]
MKVSLDLVINSGENEVDMDYALQTLSGASGVTSIITEAILRGKVKENRHQNNEIRTKLKHSFTGSFGQCFDVVISDKNVAARLSTMTRTVFSEVMSYYIYESLFLESPRLSDAAIRIIKGLEDIEDELTKAIRNRLKNMHKISTMCNYSVDLNYRKPGGKQRIATLNEHTALNITELIETDHDHYIEAIITRFNTFTGNGRLLVNGEEKTTSFGFLNGLKYVTDAQTKKITSNLDVNNRLAEEEREHLLLKVRDMTISNGEIVKYLVIEVEDL